MGAIFSRIFFSVALVLLTWNPSGWSYVDWALRDRASLDALKVFVGLVMLGGWAFCVRAAWISLGTFGVVLVGALVATLIWMLVQYGFISARDTSTLVWLALIAVGIVLGVGMSWAKVRQRATGQVETS